MEPTHHSCRQTGVSSQHLFLLRPSRQPPPLFLSLPSLDLAPQSSHSHCLKSDPHYLSLEPAVAQQLVLSTPDFYNVTHVCFPRGSTGKESIYHAGDLRSTPALGRSPEKGTATHSSILAWRIPRTV